jgi:hypothetical protein
MSEAIIVNEDEIWAFFQSVQAETLTTVKDYRTTKTVDGKRMLSAIDLMHRATGLGKNICANQLANWFDNETLFSITFEARVSNYHWSYDNCRIMCSRSLMHFVPTRIMCNSVITSNTNVQPA